MQLPHPVTYSGTLSSQKVGGARTVWVAITVAPKTSGKRIDVQLYLIDKTPTRLPEAHWFTFAPVAKRETDSWLVSKLGSMINPAEVVLVRDRPEV